MRRAEKSISEEEGVHFPVKKGGSASIVPYLAYVFIHFLLFTSKEWRNPN